MVANRFRFAILSWFAPVLMIIVGCGPARLLAPPSSWPAEWKNRRLYNTPNAFIYAGSDAAAGEADSLAEKVAREFKKRTGGRPVKGLLLVTDLNQQPVIPDHRTYCKLMLVRQTPGHRGSPSEAQLDEQCDAIVQAMAQQGTDPEMELLITPASLSASDLLDRLGLGRAVASSVDWAVALSTSALIEQAVRENMQSELKHREIGLVLQVPLAPIIMFEERLRNAKASVSRDVTVFRRLAGLQAGWSDDRRQDETQAYMERKLNEALLPVLTQLTDILQLLAQQIEPLLPGSTPSQDQGSQQQD
ncbi:MAG: hypothetical protein IIB59_01750 [Planctomycetes bacterium]|nr:hypothetical protein [Planctomycetota bacterium]